ncbi:MAG TPA: YdeI/OmpD-associated family protein [Ktedonobacterales bacterium]|nr:YdeI/OmpD-associated family protein [Ktedonobacterales bacterium]
MKNTPEFYAQDRAAWRAWLETHHDREHSVWLVYDKGAPGQPRPLPYDAIVEEALCFGWVDSVPGKVSDTQAKLYISRRKPKSAWSKANKERIAKLREAGLMMPAGEQAVAIAQANGMWEHLETSDQFELPPELVAQLAANPRAQAFFSVMPPSSHRIILEWIYAARTEETKLKRIHETVEMAAKGIKAHHYRQ